MREFVRAKPIAHPLARVTAASKASSIEKQKPAKRHKSRKVYPAEGCGGLSLPSSIAPYIKHSYPPTPVESPYPSLSSAPPNSQSFGPLCSTLPLISPLIYSQPDYFLGQISPVTQSKLPLPLHESLAHNPLTFDLFSSLASDSQALSACKLSHAKPQSPRLPAPALSPCADSTPPRHSPLNLSVEQQISISNKVFQDLLGPS